jgi:Ca-activated chloride channel family protein
MGIPMISTDLLLKTSIEDAFRKEKRFKVAEAAESADFVFFAFSIYPEYLITGSPPSPPGTREVVHDIIVKEYGIDSPYSTETAHVISFVLSAPAYRQVRKDAETISNAALWQGFVMSSADANSCNHTVQRSTADYLVRKFREDVLQTKKPARPSMPQRTQDGADKNAPALKTADPPQLPAALPPVSKDAAAIRIETSLVTAPISVLDRGGRFVPNLTQSDFHVFEDNVEQKIDHFSTTEAAFNVVLLLDTSISMHVQGTDVQRAATAFVRELHSQDRVSVILVNSEVYIRTDFTSNRFLLENAIYQAGNGSGTRLYDAVDLVLTQWLSRIHDRKAIVLFTDGVDTESRLTDAARSIELTEESGSLIYTIRYDTANDVPDPYTVSAFGKGTVGSRSTVPVAGADAYVTAAPSNVSLTGVEAYRKASQYLSDLAERTGARGFQAKTIGDLDLAFSQIAVDLRQQYEITYYPTNTAHDGAYRHIRVQVDRPDVAVRTRPGYHAR